MSYKITAKNLKLKIYFIRRSNCELDRSATVLPYKNTAFLIKNAPLYYKNDKMRQFTYFGVRFWLSIQYW